MTKGSAVDLDGKPLVDVPTPPKGVRKKGLLASLGPGLITGASDDDPSGIATYSQVGAQYGTGMLWTMPFSYPLMCGIQEISAQIGRVTGRGIAGNLRRHYPRAVLYTIVLMVLTANVINLGADINAMGGAAAMLSGLPALPFAALFAIGSLTLQILAPYDKYASILRWLCLALFAYVVTVFVVHVHWGQALRATVVPHIEFKAAFLTGIIAVLGTTISPYLFFWQASEEVEVQEAEPDEQPLKSAPEQGPTQLQRIRTDTYSGMAFSNVISYFIILTAAATLYKAGAHNIQTAQQAASALRPLAGQFAYLIFALGIIGTGLLAIPVLAGSAAYAVSEAMHWRVGLSNDLIQARRFYGVIACATLVGLGMCFAHVDPIKALFWSAVINGVVAGPIMVMMMLLTANKRVMGEFTLNVRQKILGWAATAVMLIATVGLFATWGK